MKQLTIINFQTIQLAHATQYQWNNNPIKKWERVFTSSTHVLKLKQYREDYHGPKHKNDKQICKVFHNLKKIWQSDLNRYLSKEYIQIANKHEKMLNIAHY